MTTIKRAYLRCEEPLKNKSAFFVLVAEIDLFGFALSRWWGRIGFAGRRPLTHRFRNENELLTEFDRVLRLRFAHGYKIFADD